MSSSRTCEQLRNKFDHNDTFIISGHQLKKIRRQRRSVPEWALELKSSKLQDLLLTVFPRLKEDPGQRKRAGRWALVIYMYFQGGYTYSETAESLGEKPETIHTLVRSIRRVVQGNRADGSGSRKSVG